jgi:hypothetical protein
MTLQFPPSDRTSRPDVPIADAYLLDDGCDVEVVDADYFSLPFACDANLDETVTPLECLASFDHGLRAADETALVIGTECAAQVVVALMRGFGVAVDVHAVDWHGLALADVGVDYGGDDWCDDPGDSQALYEWCDAMESLARDAGVIVESSVDAGMTWLYVPMCEPITPGDDDDASDDVRLRCVECASALYAPEAPDDAALVCSVCASERDAADEARAMYEAITRDGAA